MENRFWRELLCVFLMLFAYSAIRSPVPAVNEPHYLNKAKHFWQPDWCQKDLFMQSSNPHYVFYATCGGLTRFLSLEQTAWVVRTAQHALLAIGWCLLCRRMVPAAGAASLSCALFLLLATIGNFSGEWVVGGAESKVFTYGFALLCLAFHFRQQTVALAACLGLAVSFHPVVGVWTLLAFGFAEITAGKYSLLRSGPLRSRLPAAIGVFVWCAIPGLLPALQVALASDATSKVRVTADYIQVFGRLRHHLDPLDFSAYGWIMYAILLVAWLAIGRLGVRTEHSRWLARFVAASVIFAVAGVILGYGPRPAYQMAGYEWRSALLKFYPFRLFDAFLPLALSISVATEICTRYGLPREASGEDHRGRQSVLPAAVALVAYSLAMFLWRPSVAPDRLTPAARAHWRQVCAWVRANTPESAVCLTPHRNHDFKWNAHRAEYVTFKDCPQDASRLVEWNDRLWHVQRWSSAAAEDGLYTNSEVAEFVVETGITHIVTPQLGPFETKPVYESGPFRVYDCAEFTKADER